MKHFSIKALVLIVVLVVAWLVGSWTSESWRLGETEPQAEMVDPEEMTSSYYDGPVDSLPGPEPCVPTFADGGGPYYKANVPFRDDIAPEAHAGEPLMVQGRIWNGDCSAPLAGVVLDVWQASEEGEYEAGWYRGRVTTGDDGSFSFSTVVPEGYGEGTGYRPPHIHFKVWGGNRLLITSQMFFSEAAGRPGFDEAYIMQVEKQGEGWEAWHDIVVP
jgi:protocatechuate 3,4-dioxygenase beta subunit